MNPYSRMLAAILALLICSSDLILSEIRSAHAAVVECVKEHDEWNGIFQTQNIRKY